MTEHEEEYLRERRAEADAGARERKAEPTPGPWRLGHDAQGPCMVLHPTKHGITITNLGDGFRPAEGYHDQENWPGERNANALLIAAAPDLLSAARLAHAALDAATSTLAGLDLSPGSRLDELCGELAAAREACEGALGRAEGGEG